MQHSHVLRKWYVDYQKEEMDTSDNTQLIPVQQSLSFAPHRYESLAKPFTICLLTLNAVILTAIRSHQERKSDHAAAEAKLFLQFVSGVPGARNLALAGMLADAADECLMITRAFDVETVDTAVAHAEADKFVKAVQTLFVQQACCDVQGHTKVALDAILKQKVWFDAGMPRTIGLPHGLPPAELASALSRMAAWTALAVTVVRTEFPDLEVIKAFSVFSLASDTLDVDTSAWELLAQVFSVDAVQLRVEWDGLAGIARYSHNQNKGTNFDAWKQAVAQTTDVRRNYPITNLLPVLQAYGAATISTSGVEQNFSTRDWISPKRRSISPQHELDHLQIATAVQTKPEVVALFRDAQLIWTQLYGKPRANRKERLRGWKCRAPLLASARQKLQTWLAARRTARLAASAKSHSLSRTDCVAAARELASDVWTARHEHEAQRQAKLQHVQQLEAVLDGHILAREVTPQLEVESAALAEIAGKARAQRDKQEIARRNALARPALATLSLRVHVAQCCLLPIEEVNKTLLSFHMRRAAPPDNFNVLVVADLGTVRLVDKCTAMLNGARIVTSEFFTSGGARGPSVAYTSPLHLQKSIFVSDAFRAAHANVVHAIETCMARSRGNNWVLLPSFLAWLTATVHNTKNAAKFLALVTPEEKNAHRATANHKYCMCLNDFLDHIGRVDLAQSSLGFAQH